MRYLVTLDFVEPGPLLPPQEAAQLVRQVILPTQEALARMESEGKIVGGGIVSGARFGAFILNAESNEELNQVLQSLPAWGVLKVDAKPLLSFETRREHEIEALERLEATLQ